MPYNEEIHKCEGVDACRLAVYQSHISYSSCLKDAQRFQSKLKVSKEFKRRRDPRNVIQFYRWETRNKRHPKYLWLRYQPRGRKLIMRRVWQARRSSCSARIRRPRRWAVQRKWFPLTSQYGGCQSPESGRERGRSGIILLKSVSLRHGGKCCRWRRITERDSVDVAFRCHGIEGGTKETRTEWEASQKPDWEDKLQGERDFVSNTRVQYTGSFQD